jgi:hypothetical protein
MELESNQFSQAHLVWPNWMHQRGWNTLSLAVKQGRVGQMLHGFETHESRHHPHKICITTTTRNNECEIMDAVLVIMKI